MPEPVDPSTFTTSEQFFEASHSALETYEKEPDQAKKADLFKLVKSHTAKGKELLAKERETRGQFAIPEAHKSKPWAAKIKSQDDIFAQLDHLTEAVGKKEVPFDYATAKPEEIEAHLAVRRPAKPEDYKIGKEGDAEEVVSGMKAVAHKAGLDEYQANIMLEQFREYETAKKQAAFDSDDYNKRAEEAFGKDFKVEAGKSSNLLIANVSPEEKEFFEKNFPNQHAIFVHKLLNKLIKQYGIVESDRGGGGGKGGGGGNIEAIEKQISEKRSEIMALNKRPHTAEQKQRLVAELTSLTEKRENLKPKK